jgi:hypothetical protein
MSFEFAFTNAKSVTVLLTAGTFRRVTDRLNAAGNPVRQGNAILSVTADGYAVYTNRRGELSEPTASEVVALVKAGMVTQDAVSEFDVPIAATVEAPQGELISA